MHSICYLKRIAILRCHYIKEATETMTIDEKENRCKTSGTVILGEEEVFPSFS